MKTVLKGTEQKYSGVRGIPREISEVTVNAPTSIKMKYVTNGYRSDKKLLHLTSYLTHLTFTYSLTYSLTHLFTYQLTYSLTQLRIH